MREEKPRKSRIEQVQRVGIRLGIVIIVWVVIAYILLPVEWLWFFREHPKLDDIPTITQTTTGIPGDPLNVALIGTEKELKQAMIGSKWYPADPLTLESCLEIAETTVLKRPYDTAPVSNLYWSGRREDLAFEMPVGPDPRRRHHVRFWKTTKIGEDDRPEWVGSATFDSRVGLSHTTGEITHHIDANIDAERDHVIQTLKEAGYLAEESIVKDFQKKHEGRNGGGDPWHTDGNLLLGVLKD